jgi:hypothetical protein
MADVFHGPYMNVKQMRKSTQLISSGCHEKICVNGCYICELPGVLRKKFPFLYANRYSSPMEIGIYVEVNCQSQVSIYMSYLASRDGN